MTNRFSSIDDLLKEVTITPLQEETIRLLSQAEYKPEPIESPFIPGWDTKRLILAPERVLEPCQILQVHDMAPVAVYGLRRNLMMPLNRDENGQILPDYNFKMNLITVLLLTVLAPFGFYYLIGRWLLVHDTIVLELSDGSFVLVLRWNERINWWLYAWVASCFVR